jgi:hypothetical protein
MGLDMFACVTDEQIPAVDFEKPSAWSELYYWRKHPNIHGWMEQLYRAKGGRCEEFNVAPVRLDEADLEALEQAVNNDTLPETAGFFFGVSEPEEKQGDLEFIRLAREAIRHGQRVFYYAWW